MIRKALTAVVFLVVFTPLIGNAQDIKQGEIGFVFVGTYMDIVRSMGRDTDDIQVVFGKDSFPIFKSGDQEILLMAADLEREPGGYPVFIRYKDLVLREEKAKVIENSFSRVKYNRRHPISGLSSNERRAVERRRELLKEVLSERSHKRIWSSLFTYPMDSVYSTSSFGTTRVYEDTTARHTGTDFNAPLGTEVKAISEGEVLWAEDENLLFGGQTIVLDHGQGIVSIYMHMSEVSVVSGEFVEQREVLGEVGKSSSVQTPHLHLEVRVWDERVDPLQFINYIEKNTEN